jgi:hypothetical protein
VDSGYIIADIVALGYNSFHKRRYAREKTRKAEEEREEQK